MENSFFKFFKRSSGSKLGPLELLVLQPTPFCNLNCDYCYLPDRSATHRMKPEVIEKTFIEVFQSGIAPNPFSVVWHAGEPTVVGIPFYEEALRIIDGIKPKEARITHSFQTNATLLTDQWCEFIKRNNFVIGVSIDGPAVLHDMHRKTRSGAGTHEKVMKGIRLLQKHGIGFNTISVLTRDALDRPDEVFYFFLENRIFHVGFNVEEREGNHTASSLEQEGTEERFSRFMSRFYDLNESCGRQLRVREFSRFENSIKNWNPQRAENALVAGTQENAPFKIVSVSWDGQFSTYSPELLGVDVPVHGNFTFGNVLHDSFQEAIKTPKFLEASASIRRGIEKCSRNCGYFSVCGGGSPANKIFENGTFDSSQTMHCRLHVQTLAEVVLSKSEVSAAQTSS